MKNKHSAWRLEPADPVDFDQLRRDSHTRMTWTIAVVFTFSLILLWLTTKLPTDTAPTEEIPNELQPR